MANNSSNTYTNYFEYKAGLLIWKTIPPLLITFGTLGNILSIIVLTRKSIRKSSSALYLTCLTFSDLIVLYTGLLRHWVLYLFGLDIRHLVEFVCKLHIWLVYSSLDFSAWMLIAVTLDRIVAVWCPYDSKIKCRKQNAIAFIVSIVILDLGLNAHLLYGMVNKDMETHKTKCVSINDGYSIFFRSVWSWIDLCMFFLIPFCVILIGNSFILYKVIRRHRFRKPKDMLDSHETDRRRIRHKNNQSPSMTPMLLTLNTVYLVTALPISIYDVTYTYVHETEDQRLKARLDLWWAVVNMLMYTNNAVNFLLYSLSGSLFRQEFKRILCPVWHRRTNYVLTKDVHVHLEGMDETDALDK